MHGDTSGNSLNGGVTGGASQCLSVDVTAMKPAAAAAADKRRETTTTGTTTKTETLGQGICLDELAPVLEDTADNWLETYKLAQHVLQSYRFTWAIGVAIVQQMEEMLDHGLQ